MDKIELLQGLAKSPMLIRRIVQPVATSGTLTLGGSGYTVDLATYEALEGLLADGMVRFTKTEIAGANYIEELWAHLEPRGALFLEGELAKQRIAVAG